MEVVLQKQFSMFIASKTGKEASVSAAAIVMKFTCRHCSATITIRYMAHFIYSCLCAEVVALFNALAYNRVRQGISSFSAIFEGKTFQVNIGILAVQ